MPFVHPLLNGQTCSAVTRDTAILISITADDDEEVILTWWSFDIVAGK